jgi:hypothetical protein
MSAPDAFGLVEDGLLRRRQAAVEGHVDIERRGMGRARQHNQGDEHTGAPMALQCSLHIGPHARRDLNCTGPAQRPNA